MSERERKIALEREGERERERVRKKSEKKTEKERKKERDVCVYKTYYI